MQNTDLFLETFIFDTKPPEIFERYGQSYHITVGTPGKRCLQNRYCTAHCPGLRAQTMPHNRLGSPALRVSKNIFLL